MDSGVQVTELISLEQITAQWTSRAFGAEVVCDHILRKYHVISIFIDCSLFGYPWSCRNPFGCLAVVLRVLRAHYL